MSQRATWKNGSKTVSGTWKYFWSADKFVIWLDSIDPVTGQRRKIETWNDSPEWGNWKLVKELASDNTRA